MGKRIELETVFRPGAKGSGLKKRDTANKAAGGVPQVRSDLGKSDTGPRSAGGALPGQGGGSTSTLPGLSPAEMELERLRKAGRVRAARHRARVKAQLAELERLKRERG